MADKGKFQTHHDLAGKAMQAGDHKTAAHHLGHALSACREVHGPPVKETEAAPVPSPSLRGKLAAFMKGRSL